MKVIVNLPNEPDNIKELEHRVANFHATLLLHKIQNLNIDEISQKKIFQSVLEHINNKEHMDS